MIFDWFKPKNKKNVVVPMKGTALLSGMELIKSFTTESEPKVVDFPKEKYSVFWEIILETTEAGYIAVVRFYDYFGKVIKETKYGAITVEELKESVNKDILATMAQNKR
jgi:hypothetical protein